MESRESAIAISCTETGLFQKKWIRVTQKGPKLLREEYTVVLRAKNGRSQLPCNSGFLRQLFGWLFLLPCESRHRVVVFPTAVDALDTGKVVRTTTGVITLTEKSRPVEFSTARNA